MTTAVELVQRAQLDPTDTLVCVDAMALDDTIKRLTNERDNLLESLRSACRDIDGACRRLVGVDSSRCSLENAVSRVLSRLDMAGMR